MMIRTYEQVLRLPTFEERFEYLKLGGEVGMSTFGFERHLNQTFYHSPEWRRFRNDIIIRDQACDLAVEGREISVRLFIHHLNPLTIEDIEKQTRWVFDPNNVICTTHKTHNAIHYGDASLLLQLPTERRKGDTCPWKVY